MKVTGIRRSFHSHGEENDETRREKLLQLLRELMSTHPSIVRLNRGIATSGKLNVDLCKNIIESLSDKKDRRSVRARHIIIRLLRLHGHEY